MLEICLFASTLRCGSWSIPYAADRESAGRIMSYVLVALLGAACGVFASWTMLVPIVGVVAIASGVAGAAHRQDHSVTAGRTLARDGNHAR